MSLTTLSDYTLLHIFGYLDATSLYQLSSTSERFSQLVRTKKLWKYIDGRNNPKTIEKAGFITGNIRDNAETVLLSGRSNKNLVVSNDFFNIIKTRNVNNLTVLALENQHLMVGRLSDFPPSLVELSLRKSFILTSGFFKHSFQAMANLKVLVMDQCRWINTECLMSISKFRKLEILSLYKCSKVTDDDMAYLNLASYGFANLKVLDVRFTDLGNSLMRSFEGNKTLQLLYFSSFSTAYYPDFKARSQILIKDPTGVKPHHYLDPIFDFDESDPGQFKELFGAELKDLQKKEYQNLSHQGVRSVRALRNRPNSGYSPIHPSLLYTSPYPPCTCHDVIGCDDDNSAAAASLSEDTPVKLRPIYAMMEDPAVESAGDGIAVTPGGDLATFVARREFTVAVDRRLFSYADRQNREAEREDNGDNREDRGVNRREGDGGVNGEDREGNVRENGLENRENGEENRREDGEANGEERGDNREDGDANREVGSANGENKEDKSANRENRDNNSEDKTDKTNEEDWGNVNEFSRQLGLVLDRLGLAVKVNDRLAARRAMIGRIAKVESVNSSRSNLANGNTVNGAIKPDFANLPGCSSNLLRLIELHSERGLNKDDLEPPKIEVVEDKRALVEVVEPEDVVVEEKREGNEENRVGGRKRLRETTKEESNGVDVENDEDKTNTNGKRKKGDTSLSTTNNMDVEAAADDVKNDKKRKMDDDGDDTEEDKKMKKTDTDVKELDKAHEDGNNDSKKNVNGNLEEDIIYGDLDDISGKLGSGVGGSTKTNSCQSHQDKGDSYSSEDEDSDDVAFISAVMDLPKEVVRSRKLDEPSGSASGIDGDASTSSDLHPRKRHKRSTSNPNPNQLDQQNNAVLSDGQQLPESPPKLDLDDQKGANGLVEENQQPQPNDGLVVGDNEENAERVNEENDEIVQANNREENNAIVNENNAIVNENNRAPPVEPNRPPQLDPAQLQIRAHLLEHYYHHPPNRAFYRNHDGIIEINLRDVFRERQQRRHNHPLGHNDDDDEMNPFVARHLDRNEPVQIVGFNDNAGGETPLRELSLRGYLNVTDRSLEWLESHATQLELLDVTYTGVTVEGLRRFKAAVGDGCRVVCADKAAAAAVVKGGLCACTPDMHF